MAFGEETFKRALRRELKASRFYNRVAVRLVLPGQKDVRSCEVHALMPFADRLWVATGWGGAGLYEVDADFNLIPRSEGVPTDNFGRVWHSGLNVIVIGSHVVDLDGRVARHDAPTVAFAVRDDRTVFAVGGDGVVEWLNPVTLEHAKVTDVPRGAYPTAIPRCKDAVFKDGKLYVASARQYPDYVGLQYYDPATGTWTEVADGVFHALWTDYDVGWNNPLYAFGHDELSALMLVSWDGTTFTRFRLPKARPDFDYSDASMWRVRRISAYSALAYVHGMFYEIPNFHNIYGLKGMTGALIVRPISTTLWNVFDFAPFMGMLAVGRTEIYPPEGGSGAGQVQSGLDFFRLEDLWGFGRPRGYGGVWKDTSVSAGATSDPFLIYGFDVKTLHLWSDTPGTFTIEVDPVGDGSWKTYDTVTLTSARLYDKYIITGDAVWCRVRFDTVARVGAWFQLR